MHFHRDLEHLKQQILHLGATVEEAVVKAIVSLTKRRTDLAEEVISGDRVIDLKEVLIEEECLKILALHQPVAHDLRLIVTVLKVNNDLERMADLAVNLAERSAYTSTHDKIGVELDFEGMGERVRTMLRECLDALVRLDVELARHVLEADDEVDNDNRRMFEILQSAMKERPECVPTAIHLLSASRHLERIADLSTNIAEDVIFMVEGEVIRHRTEDYRKK